MTEKNTSYRVTFTLEEIKPIVIKHIEQAHNINNRFCLSKCKLYELWHSPLIDFYKKHKRTKPTMADKLCFVLLLSYPKNIIESINDISEIKLFSHENTDFIYKEELAFNQEEDESDRYDCICSYERLKTIFIVENKYSGINIQVGSMCITKYNIISNEELKKFKETEKLLKEKQKEIKEGKPIGYYKEEKEKKKNEKERIKLEKENEKKQKKINSGNFKTCYNCNTNLVDIRKDKLCICNKCRRNNNYKELYCLDIEKYGFNQCENCCNNFIDLKQKDPYLCKNCKIENKIMKCNIFLCSTYMVVSINLNYVFCDDCEKKIIKCIDCKKDFIQNTNESRCKYCQHNYENNYVNKKCVYCNEEMIIKEKDLWRKYCKECYIEIQEIIKNPPKCKCGLYMTERSIKKDGINKGRKGLGCPIFPKGCDKFEMF